MFDLPNNNDHAVWPTAPGIRRTLLRVEAAKARSRAWRWWVGACVAVGAALLMAEPWHTMLLLLAALAPAIRGLILFTIAQDLLDDSMEGDL